jgi:tRNA uridine 5-carboxymethylaminomethyl modification enzyme
MGVMVDDLVTFGVTEPYRMFTSRAEYRLSLRADNADQRLTPLGVSLGVVGTERAAAFAARARALEEGRALAKGLTITPNEAERHGIHLNRDGVRRSAFELLARPDIGVAELARIWPQLGCLDRFVSEQIETEAKYAVYVDRQSADMEELRSEDAVALPSDLAFEAMPGLSNELRDKLNAVRPTTLGQASRIEGMTPAALALLLAATRRRGGRAAA